MIKDPFELYRKPEVKRILNILIGAAAVILVIYCFASLVWQYNLTDFWGWFNDAGLLLLVGIIFIYIGYSILNGKFKPNPTAMMQPFQRGAPQRSTQPQVDECAICGNQFPINQLEKFSNTHGEYILICKKCKNE